MGTDTAHQKKKIGDLVKRLFNLKKERNDYEWIRFMCCWIRSINGNNQHRFIFEISIAE